MDTTVRSTASILFLSFIALSVSFAQGTVTALGKGSVASKPSGDSIVSHIDRGDVLTVLQVDDEWIKVMLPEKKSGWVRRTMVQMPDPDSAVISRPWPLFGKRGNPYASWDTTGPVVGHVRKGMAARRLLLHGGWYELEFSGGLRGWVPMHVVEPSLSEITTLHRDMIARVDTSKRSIDSKANFSIGGGRKVIQLARGIGWVKVRAADGREGWIDQNALFIEGGLPVDAANVFLYRTFERLDKFGDTHPLLALVVLVIQWIVLPLIPGITLFFLYYYTIGKARFMNNLLVKIGYGLVIVLFGTSYIFYFITAIPPFMGGFRGGIMELWSFALLIGVTMRMTHRITYDRCNSCRRIGAGEVQGVSGGGSSTNVETVKTTYGYADGHTRTETAETTTKSTTTVYRVKCRHCGYVWEVAESSSTSNKKTK